MVTFTACEVGPLVFNVKELGLTEVPVPEPEVYVTWIVRDAAPLLGKTWMVAE